MGTSTSWAQVGSKFDRLAVEYSEMPRKTVAQASLATKKSVEVFMPSHLRGAGKRGAKLSVRYILSGDDSRVFVTGPAQLIENDTKAHVIPKARGGRARRRYAVIGGQPYSRANHPGTKGKHPWAKGVEVAMPVVQRLFDAEATLALRRVF